MDIETGLSHAKDIDWVFQTSGGQVDLFIDNVELYRNCDQPPPEPPTDVVSREPGALGLRDSPDVPGEASSALVSVEGQAFSQAVEATFTTDLAWPWDAYLLAPNISAARAGDVMQATFSGSLRRRAGGALRQGALPRVFPGLTKTPTRARASSSSRSTCLPIGPSSRCPSRRPRAST